MKEKVQHYLGFRMESRHHDEILRRIYQDQRRRDLKLHIVVIIYEVIMMITISLLPGGPFDRPRRTAYFAMYVILTLVTLAVILIEQRLAKKEDCYRQHFMVEGFYMMFFCLWGIGITLNDQLGGNGLTVYNYTVLVVGLFALIRPWQSCLLFASCFLLLNALLPCFPDPNGLDQSFNNFMNSMFISIFGALLSTHFYNDRMEIKKNEIIIGYQYQHIEKANIVLSQEILIDNLTQLHNRRYLHEVVSERIREAQNKKSAVACMMIDIDLFKKYNDSYGHQKGDKLLIEFSEYLKAVFEKQDADIIRYGGEEFVIFLYDDSATDAWEQADRIINSMKERKMSSKETPLGYVTVSIGLHKEECVASDIRAGHLISCADLALYEAKRRGRNQVFTYKSGMQ